jgi:cell division protein FtsN
MAPKDYVKRPQAKKQAQKRRASNKKNGVGTQVSLAAWIKIAISLVIVGLFIFGLFRLQSINSSDEASDKNNSTEPVLEKFEIINPDDSLEVSEDNSQAPLPVLGEEEWAYIDSLPDYSVEVDATGPLESTKEYIMQCGSFRQNESAQELRAIIAFQGLESRILTSNGKNGLWYRVVLGPYERKRNAERHRHILRDANVNGCKIW